MIFKSVTDIEIKEINEEERSFWAVASNEGIDRDGDVILADGWDISGC